MASRSRPTSTARCSNADRVVARDQPTSTTLISALALTRANSRLACAPSASGERAASTHGTTAGSPRSTTASSTTGGASSTITCALVPLIPNDDTPARRGAPDGGQDRGSVNNDTAPADQSTCGDGTSTCSVFGITPCRIPCTILITPATPAPADVWPMFDLIDPSHNGRSAGRPCP